MAIGAGNRHCRMNSAQARRSDTRHTQNIHAKQQPEENLSPGAAEDGAILNRKRRAEQNRQEKVKDRL